MVKGVNRPNSGVMREDIMNGLPSHLASHTMFKFCIPIVKRLQFVVQQI